MIMYDFTASFVFKQGIIDRRFLIKSNESIFPRAQMVKGNKHFERDDVTLPPPLSKTKYAFMPKAQCTHFIDFIAVAPMISNVARHSAKKNQLALGEFILLAVTFMSNLDRLYVLLPTLFR